MELRPPALRLGSMRENSQRGGRPRVLIAGGGVAALEAALALRDLAGERLEVEIWAPSADFVYRPFAVGEPIPYDSLLVAWGARMLWAVPGAVPFWGVAGEGGTGGLVGKLRAGILRSVVFTMPGGHS